MPAISRRLVLSLALAIGLVGPALAADTVTVFAAASLKDALDDAAKAYKAKTGTEVKASYAASSALAKQIEAGAPADLFASADTKWMDYVAAKGLVDTATRVDLLGNSLVVVAPKASPIDRLDLTAEAFDKAVGDGKWATGTVASVPIGIYAKEALTKLGIWSKAEPKMAQADNVRAALQFVSRGEAALGIVYQTDANADPGVKVVATFPETSHAPIVYPFAVTKTASGDAAKAFLAFLTSTEARPIFEKQGFVILNK
jgi:molybdate transport system substrate-binding protein